MKMELREVIARALFDHDFGNVDLALSLGYFWGTAEEDTRERYLKTADVILLVVDPIVAAAERTGAEKMREATLRIVEDHQCADYDDACQFQIAGEIAALPLTVGTETEGQL